MHILFLTDNFPPEVNAPATRTYEHCQQWIKHKDVEVTIITCVPNFPHGTVYEGYKNKVYQKEIIDGLTVIRVWTYITNNSGFLKRILDYFSFAVSSFIVGLFQKFDIIIATSPQFFTTWSALALSVAKRKPWIFELRDLWPESIKTVGVMKQGNVIDTLEKIELGLYRCCNQVITVTEAFKNNLIKRGIDADKIEVVTNGSNLALFSPKVMDRKLKLQLGLQDKFVVGYIGTHGLAHSLDFIIESISKIEDEDIYFIFVGDGAMKATVVSLAKHLNLPNVTFLDAINKDQVPRYLSLCDISLAPLRKNDNFKKVIPSKIFEASAMKKPTLLGVQGEAQNLVNHYGAGLCFEPENQQDFIEKLMELKNQEQYQRCQEGCVALANDFDRKKLANRMFGIIKSTQEK